MSEDTKKVLTFTVMLKTYKAEKCHRVVIFDDNSNVLHEAVGKMFVPGTAISFFNSTCHNIEKFGLWECSALYYSQEAHDYIGRFKIFTFKGLWVWGLGDE